MKQTEMTNYCKKILADLKQIGVVTNNPEDVAFMVDNDSDRIVVDYKCMSTKLNYTKDQVDKQEVLDAGFKWWGTWNYNEK